jgi:N-acetylmuramic acid 6-phosphate etherase
VIRKLTVIGLMSGTSLDGADAALADFWEEGGHTRHRLREFLTLPMPPDLKGDLKKLMVAGTIPDLARLNMQVGRFMADAALAVIRQAGLAAADVDLIGSHGQTIWHDPAKASLQIGESAVIAEATGITTFCDFRAADIAAGGQGAPLVPYADQELYGEPGRLVGLLNIGGIANLTLLDGRVGNRPRAVKAFDTGPGNVLIDGLCDRIWKEAYDRDGRHAHAGQIRPDLLRELLAHPFFEKAPPKSTGREVFGDSFLGGVLTRASVLKVKPEDIMATVTALTPMTIADAFERFVTERPHAVRVSGGGVHNPVLMRDLSKVLHGIDVTVLPDADAKEAVAFALFAYRAAFGLENHVPETTGAKRTAILGKLAPGQNYARVLLGAPVARRSSPPASQDGFKVLATESRHPASARLDSLSPADLATLMAEEEYAVTRAVEAAVPDLAAAIATIAERMQQGGRLYYVGAGTSGRLGVLDASECPPTFSTPPGLVQGIIAGGSEALVRAVEGAEDDWKAGAADFMACHPSGLDTVVGLSASGTAPYVDGTLRCAKKLGCVTFLITSNTGQEREHVDRVIALPVGPEILSGSTRMKAGTATKVALNILSTGVMVRLGKCFGNLMVDLQVSNEKLWRRAARILNEVAGVEEADADVLLQAAGGSVKIAIAMRRLGIDVAEAKEALARSGGSLRAILGD